MRIDAGGWAGREGRIVLPAWAYRAGRVSGIFAVAIFAALILHGATTGGEVAGPALMAATVALLTVDFARKGKQADG